MGEQYKEVTFDNIFKLHNKKHKIKSVRLINRKNDDRYSIISFDCVKRSGKNIIISLLVKYNKNGKDVFRRITRNSIKKYLLEYSYKEDKRV